MARQEISSTFSDGLMMDLNPINTPKSVLTDCLNGTYITYNGNEFVLQNDMGNYKLKNCKLPTNFIPVGVKGYGDILYIVSYNPITNETEIGSYPAPQSIFTTGETEDALESTPDQLAPFAWGPETDIPDIEVEYPTIIRTNKKPIFIFAGTDEETYKLNPGDEFRFSGNVDIPTFKYQHLNFYIIDEDNKLYDIDDTQIYNENGSLVSLDLRKVFWETPGWLAAQYDLYVPDKFNLNLRSLNVPEFLVAQPDDGTSSQVEGEIPLDDQIPSDTQFKVSMDLSSQTIITDKLFQTELDKNFNHSIENDPWEKNPANVYDHLYIRYLIKQNQNPPDEGEDDYGTFKGIVVSLDDGTTKDYTNGVTEGDYVYYDIPVWKHNYQDDIITAYNNIRPIWFCNNPNKNQQTGDLDIANYHGVVELTAYPIIKYNELTLKYTQFSTTQRFPLNTLKNSSDITIADSIYKWSVDDDSCTISFNINGPFINASDITGRYEIYRINLFDNTKWPNINTAPNLDNPECYSKWTNTELFKLTTEEITNDENGIWTNENWGNEQHYTELTNQKKLLMCKGNISNLVLYGQNTLNIDWNNSNKIILKGYQNRYTNPDFDSSTTVNSTTNKGYVDDSNYDGSESSIKTIDFSKEGGIYIFRVILEQNGSTLNITNKVLIPSKVFNEWFGSIDNYLDETTGITSSMWVGKWLDQVTQSLIINSINIAFKQNASNQYDGIYYRLNNNEYTLSTAKTSTNTWEQAIATILNKSNKTNNGYEFNSYPESNLSFIIKLNEILDDDNSILDWSYNNSTLKGNLWNSVYSENIILKDISSDIVNIINGQITLNSDLIIPWNLITSGLTTTSALLNGSGDYAFFNYTGNNIKRCTLTANDGGASGTNNDYGRALYVYLDGTKLQGAMGRGKYTDVNHGTMNTIYNTAKMSSCGYFIILRLEPNDNGNTWRSAFVNDSDGNADNAYVNEIVRAYNTKDVVCLMSAGESSTQPNTVAIIEFNGGIGSGSTNRNCTRFMNALAHIKIVRYSNTKTSVYFPTYSINLIEQNQYSITKAQINTLLNYLRVDDEYLYPNIDKLSDIFKNILFLKNLYISNQKQNTINVSPILITLNYRENNGYQSMITSLSAGFDDYNRTQNDNKIAAEERPTGSNLIFDLEERPRDTLPTDFYSTFGSMNSGFTDDYINWILDDIVRRDSTRDWSKTNVGYKTDGYTFKATNVGSDRSRSPGFIFGYYQWIDRDL